MAAVLCVICALESITETLMTLCRRANRKKKRGSFFRVSLQMCRNQYKWYVAHIIISDCGHRWQSSISLPWPCRDCLRRRNVWLCNDCDVDCWPSRTNSEVTGCDVTTMITARHTSVTFSERISIPMCCHLLRPRRRLEGSLHTLKGLVAMERQGNRAFDR